MGRQRVEPRIYRAKIHSKNIVCLCLEKA
ncbi:hypothetical protein PSP6_440207 [Paraburkholderia tropica]|nr:hypothetical protein PSP6_440207 [Paraburkholderia tropica]